MFPARGPRRKQVFNAPIQCRQDPAMANRKIEQQGIGQLPRTHNSGPQFGHRLG